MAPSPPPGPLPPALSGPFSRGYNDSSWKIVNVPHDYIVSMPYNSSNNFKTGFFPRSNGFYRKHFRLPSSWVEASLAGLGNTFRLVFEGVYKVATVYVNGIWAAGCGDSSAAHTSFDVPLDVGHGLDPAGENVIAIRIDGSYGAGHWYAGAGIYRRVWLERTPAVHITESGIFAPAMPELSGGGTVRPIVGLSNEASSGSGSGPVKVVCTLYDLAGSDAIGSSTRTVASLPPSATQVPVHVPSIDVSAPRVRQWSIRSPALYTLVTEVTSASGAETANTTIGFRDPRWDYNTGLALNGDRVKIRGFCDHNDFTG